MGDPALEAFDEFFLLSVEVSEFAVENRTIEASLGNDRHVLCATTGGHSLRMYLFRRGRVCG